MELKPWGTSKTIYRDDRSEIVEIEVKAGGYCSRHLHRRKDNLFFVVRGALLVLIRPNMEHESRRLLTADCESLLIPAGAMHQFEAQTDVVAWEIYRAVDGSTIDPADIVRFSENGIHAANAVVAHGPDRGGPHPEPNR